MNAETIRYFFEYFDIRSFLVNNNPLRLLIIFGIMCLMWIVAKFLFSLLHKKLKSLATIRHAGGQAKAKESGNVADAQPIDVGMLNNVMKNARRLVYLFILGWGLRQLVVGPVYNEVIAVIFTTLLTLAGICFIAAFVPFDMDIYFRRRGTTLKESQARSLMPIIKGVIWAIGLTFLLDNLGCHVSTIIAGLGIVGVAVGLAGQAILSDFFSYIVILIDKPFRIGDFVVLTNGKSGEIEYIGPKTTRLRSLENNLIVCANSEMTKGFIENQGSVKEREVVIEIGVSYTAPMPVVRRVPALMKEVVNSFPQCSFERACMTSFGSANYLFQLIYHVAPQPGGLAAFMMTQSEVNLELTERMNAEKMNGAYPTQSILFTDITPKNPPAPQTQNAPENPGAQS